MHRQKLPWHVVETAILKEKEWLISVFDFGQQRTTVPEEGLPRAPLSESEMLRQLSVSILRGNIRGRELKSKQANGLWMDNGRKQKIEPAKERHGGEWHRSMTAIVKAHFAEKEF